MQDHSTIHQAFREAGIDINKAEYSITPYSLNTKLSFRFENLADFANFLQMDMHADAKKMQALNELIVKEGINPDAYFYVNFYYPRVAEL